MKYDRNNAIKFTIDEDAESGNDSIQCLINIDSKLYAFMENGIFLIQTAEAIDPKNEFPETRHNYQKVAAIGTKNSFIARSIIQSKQILDSSIFEPKLDTDKILKKIWNCTELLINCESIHFKLYQDVLTMMPLCDKIVEEGKKSTVIKTLPQINDLSSNVGVFLGNAKRFLELTHELLSIFFGCPSYEAKFQSYRDWFLKNKPESKNIINLLEADNKWIRLIAFMRNAHDINHSSNDNFVKITNFKIKPGNKFTTPSWNYNFSGKKGPIQEEDTDIVSDMDVFMHNMITFFEDIFNASVEESFDKKWKLKIFKKNNDDISVNCPTVYIVGRSL